MRLVVGMTGATGAPLGVRLLEKHRPLVLVPRETPLSEIHLENLLALARKGVRIVPPMPAFYNKPTGVDDVVDHTVGRVLDQLGLPAPRVRRWSGPPEPTPPSSP